MDIEYQSGDIIFATSEIRNDGSIPDLPEQALIAEKGARGVVINQGKLEEFPQRQLYLVRFEDQEKELGLPIGVWPEEITQVSILNG